MQTYFDQIDRVRFAGPKTDNLLAFRHYNPDEIAPGKRMADHLRFTACYWHNFCWNGASMFSANSFERPWRAAGDVLEVVKHKADVASESFHKLNVSYYCSHDIDVSPEGISLREYLHNFAIITETLAEGQQQTGVKLLWSTTSCFTHPRYSAGAATNPDPEVFAWAAMQVVATMNATHQLGGENYVLRGDREGYKSLLNIDLHQGRKQIGHFLQMMVEHKHKTGFDDMLLIEPKLQELTKYQYDYNVATVYDLSKQSGLENEIKMDIRANHVTLAEHSLHHEIASAIMLGIFGSIDANCGDAQLGWDMDQLPNSVEGNTLVMYEIPKAGGFTADGLNSDAKVRRQSTDKYDTFCGHTGATDVMTLSLKLAARMIEGGKLDQGLVRCYAGWQGELGRKIIVRQMLLDNIARYAEQNSLSPQPQSGYQELLGNSVGIYTFG